MLHCCNKAVRIRLSQLINAMRAELAVQVGNNLGTLSKLHTTSLPYKVPLCLIAMYIFFRKFVQFLYNVIFLFTAGNKHD